MLALLLGGCNQEGDGVAEGEGSNPGQTEPIETDWDPFEAGLNLLADGLVVPRGATLDLGAAPTGGGVMSTSLLLSNSSDSPVSLGGEPDSWIGGDGQIGWDLPPPDTLAPGEVAEIAVTFEPTLEGLALAPLDLPNGSSWTLQGFGERPAHVVIVGRLGRTLVSDDYGASFFQDSQEADVPADDQWANDANLQDITYANGQFVAVGGVWERRFAVSEDGTSWTFVNTGYPGSLSTVDYGLGVYFATDGGSILWSTNGINWIEEASSWRPSLGSVAFGNDRFVGVSGTRRAVSLDGTSWHLDIDAATDLAAVTFGNGVFVAVGPQGRVASSADGESWNEQTIGSASRYSVAYGNGVFVLGGWPDNTWTSSDGQTWVEHPDGDSLSPLGFAGGQFFADSWVDQLWRSPDGIHWTMVHDDSDPQMGGFTAVAWGREP
jgi:hypothetical protein